MPKAEPVTREEIEFQVRKFNTFLRNRYPNMTDEEREHHVQYYRTKLSNSAARQLSFEFESKEDDQ